MYVLYCSNPIHIWFQIEEAHWWYCDEWLEKYDSLPRLGLIQFAEQVRSCAPYLRDLLGNVHESYKQWINYSKSIPVFGGVLLDPTAQYCLMVQGYHSSSFSFPKGKKDEGEETPEETAAREVHEETNFEASLLFSQSSARILTKKVQKQETTFIVVSGAPWAYPYTPQKRREILHIAWVPLDLLRGAAYDQWLIFGAPLHDSARQFVSDILDVAAELRGGSPLTRAENTTPFTVFYDQSGRVTSNYQQAHRLAMEASNNYPISLSPSPSSMPAISASSAPSNNINAANVNTADYFNNTTNLNTKSNIYNNNNNILESMLNNVFNNNNMNKKPSGEATASEMMTPVKSPNAPAMHSKSGSAGNFLNNDIFSTLFPSLKKDSINVADSNNQANATKNKKKDKKDKKDKVKNEMSSPATNQSTNNTKNNKKDDETPTLTTQHAAIQNLLSLLQKKPVANKATEKESDKINISSDVTKITYKLSDNYGELPNKVDINNSSSSLPSKIATLQAIHVLVSDDEEDSPSLVKKNKNKDKTPKEESKKENKKKTTKDKTPSSSSVLPNNTTQQQPVPVIIQILKRSSAATTPTNSMNAAESNGGVNVLLPSPILLINKNKPIINNNTINNTINAVPSPIPPPSASSVASATIPHVVTPYLIRDVAVVGPAPPATKAPIDSSNIPVSVGAASVRNHPVASITPPSMKSICQVTTTSADSSSILLSLLKNLKKPRSSAAATDQPSINRSTEISNTAAAAVDFLKSLKSSAHQASDVDRNNFQSEINNNTSNSVAISTSQEEFAPPSTTGSGLLPSSAADQLRRLLSNSVVNSNRKKDENILLTATTTMTSQKVAFNSFLVDPPPISSPNGFAPSYPPTFSSFPHQYLSTSSSSNPLMQQQQQIQQQQQQLGGVASMVTVVRKPMGILPPVQHES